MDRIINYKSGKKFTFFKEFEYRDLFPYTIAVLMIPGEIYILHSFVQITGTLH